MRSFWLFGLLGASITVSAHPRTSKQYKSYKTGVQKRVVDFESYRPGSNTQYTNGEAAVAQGLNRRTDANYVDAATALVKSVAPDATFRLVTDHYVDSNGVAHVYFKQTAHGIDIDNGDFNVNVNPDGSIFSYGNSFFSGPLPETSPLTKRDFSDPTAALGAVARILNLPITGEASASSIEGKTERYALTGAEGIQGKPEARLVYYTKDDKLALTWRIETDVVEDWLLSYVDAVTNEEIHAVVNYKADASYEVL